METETEMQAERERQEAPGQRPRRVAEQARVRFGHQYCSVCGQTKACDECTLCGNYACEEHLSVITLEPPDEGFICDTCARAEK